LNNLLRSFSVSLEGNLSLYFTAELSQLTLPEIYIYAIILFGTILFLVFVLYVINRKKRQVLEKIYLKLSDSDKQIFHVVRATEKQTIATVQNILSVFYSINRRNLTIEQLLPRLYRLESIGLVNISVSNLKGDPVQICRSLYSDNPIAESISKRYKLFSSLFLPLSIGSLAICYYLLQLLDVIVHSDLYGYGLVFSYEWANQYWNITALIRSSLSVGLVLLGVSLILTIVNFYNFKNGLKITNCIFFIIIIILASYSVFLLFELDFIINYDLYNFGLQFTYQWAEKYWTYMGLLFNLLSLSIGATVICFIFCIFSKPIEQNN
jgi:hypothetical protein